MISKLRQVGKYTVLPVAAALITSYHVAHYDNVYDVIKAVAALAILPFWLDLALLFVVDFFTGIAKICLWFSPWAAMYFLLF